MPRKLSNTANRALGQGSKAAKMSGKSPGSDNKIIRNPISETRTPNAKKSPAAFGKLGMNTMKAVKPSGSKKGY